VTGPPLDRVSARRRPGPSAGPSPAPAPAYNQPQQTPSINISGDWKFDIEYVVNGIRINQAGKTFTGVGFYREGGEMTISGSIFGNKVSGTWELLGHPSGYKKGSFNFIAGTNSGEGTWIHDNGVNSRLTIQKM